MTWIQLFDGLARFQIQSPFLQNKGEHHSDPVSVHFSFVLAVFISSLRPSQFILKKDEGHTYISEGTLALFSNAGIEILSLYDPSSMRTPCWE